MKWVQTIGLTILLALSVLPMQGCGASRVPPNLTPENVTKWHGTRVIKALDVVQDIAIAANATTPPLVSTDETRVIVQYHQSAVKVVSDAPAGWPALVGSGLDQAMMRVSPQLRELLGPYFTLVKAVLKEVR